jgi:iron complex outermembrane recepter protein
MRPTKPRGALDQHQERQLGSSADLRLCQQSWAAICRSSARRACSDFTRASSEARCKRSYSGLGHVRSEGGDVAVLIRPIDPLTLDFTAAYVDAKYIKTACATGAIVCTGPNAAAAPVISEGDRLIGAPWKFITSLDYVFSPVFQRKPYFHVDYTHTTAQTALLPLQDPRNDMNDTTIPGLPVTNDLSMRAGLRWGGVDLSVFGKNLTNSFPVIFVSRDYAAPYVQQYWERSVRPRTYGVTATYRY